MVKLKVILGDFQEGGDVKGSQRNKGLRYSNDTLTESLAKHLIKIKRLETWSVNLLFKHFKTSSHLMTQFLN